MIDCHRHAQDRTGTRAGGRPHAERPAVGDQGGAVQGPRPPRPGAVPRGPGRRRAVGRELQPLVGIELSHLSQQLGVLRRAGLVTSRKAGSSVVYAIKDPLLVELMAVARGFLLGSLDETRRPARRTRGVGRRGMSPDATGVRHPPGGRDPPVPPPPGRLPGPRAPRGRPTWWRASPSAWWPCPLALAFAIVAGLEPRRRPHHRHRGRPGGGRLRRFRPPGLRSDRGDGRRPAARRRPFRRRLGGHAWA